VDAENGSGGLRVCLCWLSESFPRFLSLFVFFICKRERAAERDIVAGRKEGRHRDRKYERERLGGRMEREKASVCEREREREREGEKKEEGGSQTKASLAEPTRFSSASKW